jgi:hypothetical protein
MVSLTGAEPHALITRKPEYAGNTKTRSRYEEGKIVEIWGAVRTRFYDTLPDLCQAIRDEFDPVLL